MKKILFVAGGVLIGWGAWCWYSQDPKNKKPAAGGAGGTTAGDTQVPDKPSPAHASGGLTVEENRPEVQMTITDEPTLPPPESQAIRYYDTNPAALYYRPRTTISIDDPMVAENVITIDSANTYSR